MTMPSSEVTRLRDALKKAVEALHDAEQHIADPDTQRRIQHAREEASQVHAEGRYFYDYDSHALA